MQPGGGHGGHGSKITMNNAIKVVLLVVVVGLALTPYLMVMRSESQSHSSDSQRLFSTMKETIDQLNQRVALLEQSKRATQQSTAQTAPALLPTAVVGEKDNFIGTRAIAPDARFPNWVELPPKGTTVEQWKRYENISIVYTWVDGTTKWYREQRQQFGGKNAVGGSRDRDSGELMFSMRSLFHNFKWWKGKIYLVTPGMWPQWINTSHPRIVTVDQNSLFPEDADADLPTFNTNIIEQFIWNIPGLSEQFLQVNDDYFFGQPVMPWHLFTLPTGGRIFCEKWLIPKHGYPSTAKKGLWYTSVNTTTALLNEAYGPVSRHFLKHMPYAYTVQVFKNIHKKWGPQLKAIRGHRFRHRMDLLMPLLHAYYLTHEGGDVGFNFEFAPQEEMLSTGVFWILSDAKENAEKFSRLEDKMPRFLTINDGFNTPNTAFMLKTFLRTQFPNPSPFESGKWMITH